MTKSSIDPSNENTLYNKAAALDNLGNHTGSILYYRGLLKSEKIPITGIQQTKKLVELSKKEMKDDR